MIKIKRNTGMVGMGIDVKVHVNGKLISKIKHLETTVIDIPVDESTIQVSQTGTKSNSIKVHPGEQIEIGTTNNDWYLIFMVALIPVVNSLFNRIIEVPILYYGYILLTVFVVLLYFFKDGFHLTLKKI